MYNLRSSGQRPAAGSGNNTIPAPTPAARARKVATPASRLRKTKALEPIDDGGIGNMTHEQREQLREVFEAVDQQFRGHIPVTKVPEVLQALGFGQPADEVWAEWRTAIDPEGTGRIGYDRLENFISLRYDERDQQQEIMNAFKLFKPESRDIEHARITLGDLKRVAANLGEHIPEEELQEMINIADIENSGSVGFLDFMRIMRKSGLF
ncbi:Centrin-1 [Coemansia sp. RSA 552]|nr:Centrin-1 [Coemansia sp. RSA 552]